MAKIRLPLFPLQVVLLPGEFLPLHIFEERYKQMIGECLKEKSPFGVVLVEREGIRKVGCTARVTQLLERFPDGRMNILTQGENRFEVVRIFENRPYLVGEVNFIEDAPEEPPPPGLVRQVWDAMESEERDSLPLGEEILKEPLRLSFLSAATLRLPLPEKQTILECLSTRERLERLLAILEKRKELRLLLGQHQRAAERNGHP